jgi:hypothetical protein
MKKAKKDGLLKQAPGTIIGDRLFTGSIMVKLKKDYKIFSAGVELSCLPYKAEELIKEGYGEYIENESFSVSELTGEEKKPIIITE